MDDLASRYHAAKYSIIKISTLHVAKLEVRLEYLRDIKHLLRTETEKLEKELEKDINQE